MQRGSSQCGSQCYDPIRTLNVKAQEKADNLRPVPRERSEFAQEVQHINQEFPSAYSLKFGATRCSCGLACEHGPGKYILR